MSDNLNLTKIRPGNVKNFEIRCDFCGYTLKKIKKLLIKNLRVLILMRFS